MSHPEEQNVNVSTKYYDAISTMYEHAWSEFGDDPRSQFQPKARHDLQFRHWLLDLDFQSVLDFGCGLSLLRRWLNSNGRETVQYTGADITRPFIDHCRERYPADTFLHIRDFDEVQTAADVVVVAGTFNVIPDGVSRDEHREHVFSAYEHLLRCANRYLVFDFMHDRVDFQQDGAFHMSHAEVIEFVVTRLSRRFEVLQSYMPFEAAVRVHCDDGIDFDRVIFQGAAP